MASYIVRLHRYTTRSTIDSLFYNSALARELQSLYVLYVCPRARVLPLSRYISIRVDSPLFVIGRNDPLELVRRARVSSPMERAGTRFSRSPFLILPLFPTCAFLLSLLHHLPFFMSFILSHPSLVYTSPEPLCFRRLACRCSWLSIRPVHLYFRSMFHCLDIFLTSFLLLLLFLHLLILLFIMSRLYFARKIYREHNRYYGEQKKDGGSEKTRRIEEGREKEKRKEVRRQSPVTRSIPLRTPAAYIPSLSKYTHRFVPSTTTLMKRRRSRTTMMCQFATTTFTKQNKILPYDRGDEIFNYSQVRAINNKQKLVGFIPLLIHNTFYLSTCRTFLFLYIHDGVHTLL